MNLYRLNCKLPLISPAWTYSFNSQGVLGGILAEGLVSRVGRGGGGGGITGIEFLSASQKGKAAVLIEINFSLTGFNESLKTSHQLSTGTPVISTSLWYVAILDSEALSQYQPGKLSFFGPNHHHHSMLGDCKQSTKKK